MTSCSASTEFDERYACEKAFDGNDDGWAPEHDKLIGAWIKIKFDQHRLTKVMVMQRNVDGTDRHGFKDITLEFSHGGPVYFTLLKEIGIYQTIELDKMGTNTFTNYVNITALTIYEDTFDAGFSELRVFGCLIG